MKRILTSALAIMLSIGAANAQSENKQKHEGKREHRQMSLKGVDLTAEQKTQIEKINTNFRTQMADLKSQNLPADQLKTKRRALQEQHSSDLRTLLTPEQKARLQSSREELRKSRVSKSKSEKPDIKNDKALSHRKKQQIGKDLNLSAEQAAKMKTLNQSYKAQFEALRQDRTQSEEAQKTKFQNLKNERQIAIKAILNPEQQAKMAEYRKRSKNVKR